MACIYSYKGRTFKTKKAVLDYIKSNKVETGNVKLARDVAFKTRSTGFTTVQEEEVTNTLAYKIFHFAKGDIENFATADFTALISDYITKQIPKTAGTPYQARFLEVSRHIPYFVEKVKDFYASKGITVVEELEEDEDGNMFQSNTLLIDPKQSASAKIRALVSLIPKYTKSASGEAIEDTDTFLGTPKFVEEGAMWNTLKNGLADMPNPTLEKMLEKLENMAAFQPHLNNLINALNQKRENPETGAMEVDERLRTQFFNTFAITRIKYMSVLLEGSAKEMGVRISTNDPSSQESIIVNQWVENFSRLNANMQGERYFFSGHKLDRIISEYNALNNAILKEVNSVKKLNLRDATSTRGKNSNSLAEGFKKDLLNVLAIMGINMNEAGLNNLLRSPEFQSTQGNLTIYKLNRLFSRDGLDFLVSDIQKIKDDIEKGKDVIIDEDTITPIEDNKIVRLLAQKQGEMLQDLSESMSLGAEGNLYSNHSTHTLVSSLISEWNENPSTLDEVLNTGWGAGSRLAQWVQADTKNKLDYYILNNFKALGKNDQGSKISDLSDPEALTASINITLSDGRTGTYMGLAEADKSRQVVIKGGKFESAGLVYRPTGKTLEDRYILANDNSTDILMGYFTDELIRMRLIYENLYGKTPLPENERVLYLHESKNTYTSYLFPEFNIPDTKGKLFLEKIGLITKKEINGQLVYEPIRLTEKVLNNSKLKIAIREAFVKAVAADVTLLESFNVIEKNIQTTGTEASIDFTNISIDKDIISNRYKNNVVEAIADYTLNSIIGSVETTKLFTGDPASFKNSQDDLFKDFRKRIPLIIAGGTKSRIYENKNTGQQDVRPYYTSAVVGNIVNPSNYFFPKNIPNERLLRDMVKAFNEGKPAAEQATREDMLALIAPYAKVNATDAQAWITLDTFKERMLSFGKWTKEHQDAYERMTATKPVLLKNDVNLFMQPLKTVHVEKSSANRQNFVHYNKQSEAVIIPGLFPGLEALQTANPGVDHFITLDGKKVGASGVTSINEGNQVSTTEKLKPVQLSYERLYLQQDLPTKQVKNTLVGSQVVKNLLGEILLEATYDIPLPGGKKRTLTGKELVDEYHQVVGTLSDLGHTALKEEFGYNEETGRIDQERFNDFLIKAMEEELTVTELEALDNGLTIDTLPAVRKKLESKLMAAVRKRTVKLKQLGGAMVQMSSFGTIGDVISLDSKVKDGIIFFKKDVREGLKPMQLSEKDGVLVTDKAQVLLPHKYILELLGENYKNMTPQEIKEAISPDVLMGISYRIPNQATASNDLFEIVGILPPTAGDTIISYNEITTKTGSDFDIDKAFIILPNVEKRDGKLVRPRYAFEMTNEEAYKEKFKKDWSRGIRAREIARNMEESLKDKKDAILSKIKELKGDDAITQSIRDIAPSTEDDVKEFVITSDLISLIDRHFGGEKGALEGYRGKSIEESLRVRDQLLSLKGNLKKINEAVSTKVREQLIAEGIMPSLEEFSTLPEMEKHTKAALENLRIDLMQALLGDPKTYPNAIASLDNDFLKNEAEELYAEKGAASKNLGFFRGTTQAKTKVLFDKAKSLVGVIANQMTDHKTSQADQLTYRGMNFQIGKTKDGESLVSAVTDVNGVYTSTWLNLYMNAIVDAAKDPYIIAANINQFTAPVAFMLIRSGVPAKWVNAYIGQPILKELVKLKSVREGRIAEKVYDSKTGKKLTPEQELINKYARLAGVGRDTYKDIELKELKRISADQLKAQIQKEVNPLTQLIILKTFNEFKEVSKELSESIRAAKGDVSNGKDLISAELKEAKLLDLIKKNAIRNIETKFGASLPSDTSETASKANKGFIQIDGSRMAGTFHRNGIQTALKMFSGMSIMSSNAVKNILYNTVFSIDPQLLNRETEITALMNEIYSFIIGLEGSGLASANIKDLFIGKNSVPRQVEKIKRANPELATSNILLRDLTIAYRKKEGDPDFLLFNNKNQDRELYQRAWTELFETHPELAGKLVEYSYSASGFNRNLFSFFQFIPTQELVNRGFGEFFSNLKIAFTENTVLPEATDQILRHMWTNKKIIKTVTARDTIPVGTGISKKEIFKIKDLSDYIIGNNAEGAIEVTRFLRDKNDNLYELVGYTKNKEAIYKATFKLGYSEKGRIIKEYYTPAYTTGAAQSTIFEENKVSLSEAAQAYLKYENYTYPEKVETSLKDSILVRTYEKFGVSEQEITEAMKKCKI